MTLRTSLFNKGIYKSVLKRFWWVMIPDFLALLLVPMGYLNQILNLSLTANLESSRQYIVNAWHSSYCTLFFAMIIAVMSYQSIHSKKQAIFIHSLPISKEANFISSALAGFTLIAIPIVLNGIVLRLVPMDWIVDYYKVGYALKWTGINLLYAFVVFAYATLASVLTGNGFAAFVLNIIMVWALRWIPEVMDDMAVRFLLGYEEQVIQAVDVMCCPEYWILVLTCKLFSIKNSIWLNGITIMDWAPQIIAAIAVYAVSFMLYRKRKLETAGEVAGFKALKPILKFFATFVVMMPVLGTFVNDEMKLPVVILAMVIVSAVVYFIAEAAINKTLKVWKGYKGYLCFVVIFAIVSILFTATSFFGYETRVPDVEDIESVALYDYDESIFGVSVPYVKNEELKQFTTEIHKEIVEDNLMLSGPVSEYCLNIKYRLKNGNIVSRQYGVDPKVWYKAMVKSYEYEDYLQARFAMYTDGSMSEGLDYIKIGNDIYLYGDDCNKYFEYMYKDLSENHEYIWQNVIGKIYDVTLYYNTGEYVIWDRINGTFTNTVAWLSEIGEWQKLK